MTVFKSYFKVMLRYKWLIFLYAGICIGISLLNTMSSPAAENFVASAPDVAIINHDSKSTLIDGFKEYVSKNATIKEIEDNEEKIQDELFYRSVNYVLIIPENFTADFLVGKDTKIEVKKTQDSYSTYTEMLINKYLKMVNIYNKSGMSEAQIVEAINKDLENSSEIVLQEEIETVSISKPILFFNFANYAFLGIFIYIIATLMLVFNEANIKKKNSICSTPYSKISNQIFLANLIFAFIVWLIYVLISYIMYGNIIFSTNGLLILLNSFVFSISAVAIGFFAGILCKSKEAISGIVNTVALGLSFISGCFVPQAWLNDTVLNISKLFPSYWYINGNDMIANLTKYDFDTLKPLLTNMGIMLLYALIYLVIIAVINKRRKKK